MTSFVNDKMNRTELFRIINTLILVLQLQSNTAAIKIVYLRIIKYSVQQCKMLSTLRWSTPIERLAQNPTINREFIVNTAVSDLSSTTTKKNSLRVH